MPIPAPYLFWFFFMIITKANALMLDKVKQPSCDELRLFWEDVTRSREMAEITNEIQTFPWETLSQSNYLENLKGNKYKTSKSFRGTPLLEDLQQQENGRSSLNSQSNNKAFNSMYAPDNHYSMFLPKQETHIGEIFPSSKELENLDVGTFDSSFYYGPQPDAKRRSESSQSAWGQPHEVGSFGRFVDFEEQAFLPDGRRSKGKSKNWSDVLISGGHVYPVLKQKSCKEVENRKCTDDMQCSCTSTNLMKCVRGKCNLQSTTLGRESDFGIWHDAALPRVQLGVFKRSRGTKDESTVM